MIRLLDSFVFFYNCEKYHKMLCDEIKYKCVKLIDDITSYISNIFYIINTHKSYINNIKNLMQNLFLRSINLLYI